MVIINENPKNRKSIRLKEFDYSSNGAYFITILVKERKPLLGKINNGKMVCTNIGEIAYNNWLKIPQHFDKIILDEFIIMPNHIHGIIIIQNEGKDYQNTGHDISCPYKKNDINMDEKDNGNENNRKYNVGAQYIEPEFKKPISKNPSPRKINEFQHIIPKSLGVIIQAYKASITRDISRTIDMNFKWHRGFYDRVLRNDDELNKSREYIINNSLKWELDKNNPESGKYIKSGTIY